MLEMDTDLNILHLFNISGKLQATIFSTRNIFKKKCNRRRWNVWVFDNMQSTMNTFSEALYFLHIEIMANLDHFNSIQLET